jgi:DNA-binding transcriptional ArsR family regulator
VAIRFVLPEDAAEAVATTYSPLTELSLSLRVLAFPHKHPLKHAWVRRMRRLPPALKRRIRAFSFAYRCGMPDVLFPSETPARSFGEELERVRALPPSVIASQLEDMIRMDRRLEPGAAELHGPELAEAAASFLGDEARDEAEAIRLVGADPDRSAAQFVELLDEYWHAAFHEDWRTIAPVLARTSDELETHLRRDVFRAITGLQHQVHGDPRTRSIAVDLRAEKTLVAGGASRLVISPSTFLWPAVMVKFEPPGSPGFIYPAPASARVALDFAADAELTRIVKALADDTRLRALKLLAREPRTTQELAPLLGITESGLSKHLRTLADAGLVQTRRESYYVLYSVVPARIASLSRTLLEFIDAGDASFSSGESVAAGESG